MKGEGQPLRGATIKTVICSGLRLFDSRDTTHCSKVTGQLHDNFHHSFAFAFLGHHRRSFGSGAPKPCVSNLWYRCGSKTVWVCFTIPLIFFFLFDILPRHEEQEGQDGRQRESSLEDLCGLRPAVYLEEKVGTQLGRNHDVQQELQRQAPGESPPISFLFFSFILFLIIASVLSQ